MEAQAILSRHYLLVQASRRANGLRLCGCMQNNWSGSISYVRETLLLLFAVSCLTLFLLLATLSSADKPACKKFGPRSGATKRR